MNCYCENGETNELTVEGDVGANPIWCNRCGCNLDLEDVPISDGLKKELISWGMKYGEWIDWDKDKLLPNGIALEDHFNQIGLVLAEKVKQELDGQYTIRFTPSTSARFYAKGQK